MAAFGCSVFGQALPAHADEAAPPDLSSLSIEQLGDIQVTSVSKRPETIGAAASAIYVITRDDIARSGSQTLPEILRLAPNLQVYQTSASAYVVTARGFNGAPGAQNFSNKLLVLIDGRSVYTPLYSGVYWDTQDVPPEDIERIEVISGPGATLWGANAVNGVINIITRQAADTQGLSFTGQAGDQERTADLNYGGKLGEAVTYRLYARGVWAGDTVAAAGGSNNDRFSRGQGGFRFDWAAGPHDQATLQGDLYDGTEARLGDVNQQVRGGNITARWTHQLDAGSQLQVQAYFDRTERWDAGLGTGFGIDTYDVEAQHSFALGQGQQIVWGVGLRTARVAVNGTPSITILPALQTLNLGDLFAQDTLSLGSTLKLTLGGKIEDDPYLNPQFLPSIRLAWTPSGALSGWAAVSRALRSATPFDEGIVEKAGPTVLLSGNPDFKSEKLIAYELGGRFRLGNRAQISVSGFYNDYSDLRSVEVTPVTFFPLTWGNSMTGRAYGVEVWADYQVTNWWRLSPAVTTLTERFAFRPGANPLLGTSQAGDDPKYQASLKSSMTLGSRLTLDANLRYVSALPNPRIPAYANLDARLAWAFTDKLEVSVSGHNLLHDRLVEYPQGSLIPRSVMAGVQWRY
jgi:iron complex outermembrane receptor protein